MAKRRRLSENLLDLMDLDAAYLELLTSTLAVQYSPPPAHKVTLFPIRTKVCARLR